MSAEGAGLPRGRRRVFIAVVVALGLALEVALLTVAFLLGRLSVTADRPGSSGAAVSTKTPAVALQPARDLARIVPPAAIDTVADRSLTTTPAETNPAQPAAPPRDGADISDRARVAAYFGEVDRLEDMGAGDPQAFASSLMTSVTSGDFGEFDALIAKARAQQERLRSIAPPLACVEHHRLAVALARDSVTMLERLKAALMKGDAAGLMSLSTEGRSLESRAGELKTLGATIRRQAGL